METKKFNVCIIINNLKVGGAQKLTLEQIIGLTKEKYEPYLGLVNDRGIETSYRDEVSLPKEQIVDLNFKNIFDIRGYIRLVRFLRKNNIHILITHLYNGNVVGRIAAFIARTPIIITAEHGLNIYRPKWQTFFDWLLSYVTDKIIADSTKTVDHYVKVAGVKRNKFIVLRPTLRTIALDGKFTKESVREKLGIPKDAFVAMSIGRFVKEKGLLNIVKIANRTKKSGKEIYYVIVGYGPMEGDLRKATKDAGVEDTVQIVIDPHNAKEYLIGGDVFLLPSVTEGGPITLVEAMHAGLVPIGTDVGWVKDIITKDSGFVVNVGDYKKMTEHLLWLNEHKDKRLPMKERSIAIAKNSICGMEEWEEIFEELIKKKKI